MEIEIIDQPMRFQLFGFGSVVENNAFGEVGFRLMNEMWRVVKSAEIATTGINHWVYLPDRKMFVGVELQNALQFPTDLLESIEFELTRYLKHVHVGPYQALPRKWSDLKAEITRRGEVVRGHSLEIYGHHCDDPSKLETTILIEIEPR